jgi:shikimate kinase
VFIVGFMACGKTTVGRLLADRLGLSFADTDDLIEEKEGMRVRDVFATRGEARFRELERELLAELKRASEGAAGSGHGARLDRLLSDLAAGGGAVIATGGGLPCSRGAMDLMKELGTVVYLRPGLDDILERLARMRNDEDRPVFRDLKERALGKPRRASGPGAASERGALREELAALHAGREPFYLEADIVVENGNETTRDETADRIAKALGLARRPNHG